MTRVCQGGKQQLREKLAHTLCAPKEHAVELGVCGLGCRHGAEDFLHTLWMSATKKKIKARGCLHPRKNHMGRKKKLDVCLDPNHNDGLNESDFGFNFGMGQFFACLVQLLNGHANPAFQQKKTQLTSLFCVACQNS